MINLYHWLRPVVDALAQYGLDVVDVSIQMHNGETYFDHVDRKWHFVPNYMTIVGRITCYESSDTPMTFTPDTVIDGLVVSSFERTVSFNRPTTVTLEFMQLAEKPS